MNNKRTIRRMMLTSFELLFLVLMATVFTYHASAISSPTITLTPNNSVVGVSTFVKITGSGFNGADTCSTPAKLTSTPSDITANRTGPAVCGFSGGNFLWQFTVPASAPVNLYTVTLTGSTGDSASAAYAVNSATTTITETTTQSQTTTTTRNQTTTTTRDQTTTTTRNQTITTSRNLTSSFTTSIISVSTTLHNVSITDIVASLTTTTWTGVTQTQQLNTVTQTTTTNSITTQFTSIVQGQAPLIDFNTVELIAGVIAVLAGLGLLFWYLRNNSGGSGGKPAFRIVQPPPPPMPAPAPVAPQIVYVQGPPSVTPVSSLNEPVHRLKKTGSVIDE